MSTKRERVTLFGLFGMALLMAAALNTLIGSISVSIAMAAIGIPFLIGSFLIEEEWLGKRGRIFLLQTWELICDVEYLTREDRVIVYASCACLFLFYAGVSVLAHIMGSIKAPTIPVGLLVVGLLFLYLWKSDAPHTYDRCNDPW